MYVTQCGRFQFLLILDQWGISFRAVVVFGLGKNLLFKSVLGHCGLLKQGTALPAHFQPIWLLCPMYFKIKVESILRKKKIFTFYLLISFIFLVHLAPADDPAPGLPRT